VAQSAPLHDRIPRALRPPACLMAANTALRSRPGAT